MIKLYATFLCLIIFSYICADLLHLDYIAHSNEALDFLKDEILVEGFKLRQFFDLLLSLQGILDMLNHC
jgi:hypothetical protein